MWLNAESESCKDVFSVTAVRIVSPNITLYPVWDGEFGVSQVRLICTLSGYFPKNLVVEWKQNNERLETIKQSVRNLQSAEKDETTYSLTSEVEPDMEEWNKGDRFTCKATHNYTEFEKTISICKMTPASSQKAAIYVQGPPLEQLQNKGPLTVTCLLVGSGLSRFSITWKVDGSSSHDVSTETPVSHSNGTETLLTYLNVSAEDWHSYKRVTCEGKHQCSSRGYEESIIKRTASATHSRPSAVLLQGSNQLVCLVSGFSPASINITWFRSETTKLENFTLSELHRGPDGKFSIQSHLHVSPVDSLPGVVLTCRVTHENTTLLLNVSTPDTLEDCLFFDDITDSDVSLDPLRQAWSVALTFFLLFLSALIFSVIVSIMKTK